MYMNTYLLGSLNRVSPKARDTAKTPLTLFLMMTPPAASTDDNDDNSDGSDDNYVDD
jgi:hypothetical protein